MAGKPGRSGPVADNIRIYCETHVLGLALPKIRQYLQKNPITAKEWKWCYGELLRLGGLAAEEGIGETSQERSLRMLA